MAAPINPNTYPAHVALTEKAHTRWEKLVDTEIGGFTVLSFDTMKDGKPQGKVECNGCGERKVTDLQRVAYNKPQGCRSCTAKIREEGKR